MGEAAAAAVVVVVVLLLLLLLHIQMEWRPEGPSHRSCVTEYGTDFWFVSSLKHR